MSSRYVETQIVAQNNHQNVQEIESFLSEEDDDFYRSVLFSFITNQIEITQFDICLALQFCVLKMSNLIKGVTSLH